MNKVIAKEATGTYNGSYRRRLVEWSLPFVFFIAGLPLGLFTGGYGATQLLTGLTYNHDEPCLLEQVVIFGSILFGILYALFLAYGGRLITRWIGEFLYDRRTGDVSLPVVRSHSLAGKDRVEEMEKELSFLRPYRSLLHAIVLVGSSVYGKASRNSDRDVVLICKKKGYNTVREVVFQKEIDEQFEDRGNNIKMEFTVLNEKLVRDEFRDSSPFSYSLRYGLRLYSDGFLERIESSCKAGLPTRRYIIRALYNGILTQYYGSLKDLSRDIRRAHSFSGACAQRGVCLGHGPAERLLNVIIKMLYITLPVHGYMPLTKTDVVYFAQRVYGDETAAVIEDVVNMVRADVKEISESQYHRLRKLSTGLFLEIVQYAGFSVEIKNLIKDVLCMKRGEYQRIKNPAYRNCIIS